jgi:recombinational DNA repair protein (RecF pathway)
MSLLGSAGLLPNLNVQFGTGWSATEVDFYSYTGELVSNGQAGESNSKRTDKDSPCS